MKMPLKIVSCAVVLLITFGFGWFLAARGTGQEADPASLTDLERAFTERMQNVVLEGHFTLDSQDSNTQSAQIQGDRNPELYEIEKVTKLDGNRWRFDVHLAYASVDATLPIVVPIVWAGDTPMVSIADFQIPGLGDEFGARVIFYDERYAGTWDHGPYGGLMYGSIRSMGSN